MLALLLLLLMLERSSLRVRPVETISIHIHLQSISARCAGAILQRTTDRSMMEKLQQSDRITSSIERLCGDATANNTGIYRQICLWFSLRWILFIKNVWKCSAKTIRISRVVRRGKLRR